jgi:hypothetical protein
VEAVCGTLRVEADRPRQTACHSAARTSIVSNVVHRRAQVVAVGGGPVLLHQLHRDIRAGRGARFRTEPVAVADRDHDLPCAAREARPRFGMRAALLWLLVAVLACSDDDGERIERSEFNDEGSLCVGTGATAELLVSVVVDGCASGCAGIVESRCEVVVDGADLVVHSSITVEERRGRDVICPAACVPISVGCAPMQVPPGDYLFHHAGSISAARLPTDDALLLGGGGSLPELQCR